MNGLHERVLDDPIRDRLRRNGAVLIVGPKAAGKTTLARSLARSEVRLDQDRAARIAAMADPGLALEGERPRLLDEYQVVDGLFEAVRGRIDDEGGKGLFILTGSALPPDHLPLHTGAGRIATVTLRTLSLFERKLSSGAVSLGALLDGDSPPATSDRSSVSEAVRHLAVGGWPGSLGLTDQDAMDANRDYLDTIVNVDIERVDGVRRDPDAVRRLLRSYARNVGTAAQKRTINRMSDEPVAEATLHAYLNVLERLFLIEDQGAWSSQLRSRARLLKTPKRHLADPSLAVAALGASVERLLSTEIEWTGFLFESQVVHDLRVYADPHRAEVRYHGDSAGVEIDAVVERDDGRWVAFEVKLGQNWVDQAAASLLRARSTLTESVAQRCGGLVVVTPDAPTHRRDDGVIVTSPAALGP